MKNYNAVQVTYEELEEILKSKIGSKDFLENLDANRYDFDELEIDINISEDNSNYAKDILDSLGVETDLESLYYDCEIQLRFKEIIEFMSKHINKDVESYFVNEDYICFIY